MVELGEERGTIQELEKEILNNIFDFDEKITSEIMTHRTEIVGLPIDSSLEEVVATINQQYTRIPIYSDSIDNIVGVIHAKDLLPFIAEPQSAFDLRKISRHSYFIPESKKSLICSRKCKRIKFIWPLLSMNMEGLQDW